MICSPAIVFLASFSAMSFASDVSIVMNSTQHSIKRSRVSFAKAMEEALSPWMEGEARTSLMIFWTVAGGRVLAWVAEREAARWSARQVVADWPRRWRCWGMMMGVEGVYGTYLWVGRGHRCLYTRISEQYQKVFARQVSPDSDW